MKSFSKYLFNFSKNSFIFFKSFSNKNVFVKDYSLYRKNVCDKFFRISYIKTIFLHNIFMNKKNGFKYTKINNNININNIENDFNIYNNNYNISIVLDKNESDFVILPNREGEIINLKKGKNKLKEYFSKTRQNINEMKLLYPSIASTNLLIFKVDNYIWFLYSSSNKKFLVTQYVYRENNNKVLIQIRSCEKYWFLFSLHFTKVNDNNGKLYKNNVNDLNYLYKAKPIFKYLNNKYGLKQTINKIESKYFIQVGFISPELFYDKSNEKGFMVLEDISKFVLSKIKENNIIHIFGYSKGHDIDYPDYTPSSILGGVKCLKKAVSIIHKNKQKVSIYLNARIADKKLIDRNKRLQKAIFRNKDGKVIVEKYNGRKFYVMNPESKIWQKTLFKWVKYFKKIGVDGIQLDQIGGREALTNPCKIWGKGYYNLIKKIQKLKMFIWIQGCSSIYPADIYELTYRYPKVLDNGIIRGGTPLGESTFIPIILTNNNKTFLIPTSKIKYISEDININYIIDIEYKKGELFIYNKKYLKNLKQSLDKLIV